METQKPSRTVLAGATFFGKVLHLTVSLAVIAGFSYLLGHSMLSGGLKGNDSPLHVAYATWLNQYFPSIPHWYPLQGGGESLLHGYPIAPHLLIVLIHRASELSILQAYRLIGFLSFPLIAFGIYLFAWDATRKQTVGLIAAILFLLAPVSWTWMFNWGFFSQQVALVFLPLALLAFSKALHLQLVRGNGRQRRLWFVALTVLMLAASLCHLMVGAAAGVGMGLYFLIGGFAQRRAARRAYLRSGGKIILLLTIAVALSLAAYLMPFQRYGSVANREGLNTPPAHQLHRLPVLEFFGLRAVDQLEILTRMQFPLIVPALAAMGIVQAWIRVRRGEANANQPLILGLSLIPATIFTLTPALVAIVLRLSPLLLNFINFRSTLLFEMVALPAVAAYGAWSLADSLLHPRHLTGGVKRPVTARTQPPFSVGSVASSATALIFALVGVFGAWSMTFGGPASATYGPLNKGLDFTDPWDRGPEAAGASLITQLSPANWPDWVVRDDDPLTAVSQELATVLPSDPGLRIDVSPYQGRLAMDLVNFANASQINSYTFQISLFHAMWGYQQNVFFSRETPANEYGNPRTLNGLANWFGTEYVFMDATKDPVEMYAEAGWEHYEERSGAQIWRFPSAPGLATATTRPTILVVGKPESDAYMTIFRIANDGFLPYDQALLVEGGPRVDDYSIDDLSLFDAIILYGHDYKDKRQAWELLETYVANGGGLFVDTGWEFWIPEWEFDPAPNVLPISRAIWTDYGIATDYEVGAPEIAGDVATELFKPLVWEGQPWTLSGAQPSDIRDWGRPVLTAAGNPLIVAGEFGQGRVVWSGMNLIGHARYGEPSREEFRLFGNLIKWIARSGDEDIIPAPSVSRNHPDEVDLLVAAKPGDRTWLYWREAYYPNWQAYVTDAQGRREVPIFRGGPGLMLMPIDTADGQVSVNLRWELPLVEKAASLASVLGALLLAALTVDGLLLEGNGFTWLKIGLLMGVPRPFLGDGSNKEWAERKRAELEARLEVDGAPHLKPGEAIALWGGGRVDGSAKMGSAGADGELKVAEVAIEPPGGDADRALLKAWLEGSGHGDDAWAEKLIGRQKGSTAGSRFPQSPKGKPSDGS